MPMLPLILSIALSGHGLRKKSLSPSGALCAFMVGFGMMSGGTRAFGWELIVFYLLGSRATKCESAARQIGHIDGKRRKAQLEEDYHEAGYRNGWQVLCNSVTAFIACTAWNMMYVQDSVHARLFGHQGYELGQCALEERGWSRMLLFAALGHFGCCLGDTLASELGILSPSPPVLITTWKRVPPGTNGGVSLGGTMASVMGGFAIGVTMGACLLMEHCGWGTVLPCLGWGAFAGGFGSLVDSLLGATVQETKYNAADGKISQRRTGVVAISGVDVLSNNQVNLLSSIVTAVAVAGLAGRWGHVTS
ncbi:hypothetical protein BDN72DRAFT_768622 [Pluteus cervinus]|uniref:Uncharacterized protein n=1 Tax=Pluteus cervinus TaxID=181527 RepID=A0ACD3ATJ2_9AGAR|nr:hypothetical protein BDN72DRAFT_768622 [Pluteus cervinus]